METYLGLPAAQHCAPLCILLLTCRSLTMKALTVVDTCSGLRLSGRAVDTTWRTKAGGIGQIEDVRQTGRHDVWMCVFLWQFLCFATSSLLVV